MTSAEQAYNDYQLLHDEFKTISSEVHKQAAEFYPLPKKFIERTGKEVDNYIKLFRQSNAEGASQQYRRLLYFMNHFDHFTITVNKLFTLNRSTAEKCQNYIKRVSVLTEKEKGAAFSEEVSVILIEQLQALVHELNLLQETTKKVIKDLKKLEADWKKTKQLALQLEY